MQTRTTDQIVSVHFNSLHELGEYIARTPRSWKANDSRDNRASNSWDLNCGYDAAVNMAQNGWIEGAERAQEALTAFAPRTPAPDTKTDFYGFRPHVPRFCAGAPDSMVRHTRDAENGGGRVLTLYVSVMSPSVSSASAMANYGVGIAQYVNQMETQGQRVEVIACATVYGQKRRHTVSCVLKHADQPLDLAVIAFALGHPAMLRRIWFAYMERQPHVGELPAYGQCRDTEEGDLIEPAAGTFVLNGMNRVNQHAPTAEAALKYVSEQIQTAIEAM